jgi:hypothetical protein
MVVEAFFFCCYRSWPTNIFITVYQHIIGVICYDKVLRRKILKQTKRKEEFFMTNYITYYCPIDNDEYVVIKSTDDEHFPTHEVSLVSAAKFKSSKLLHTDEQVPVYFAVMKVREYLLLMHAFRKRGYTTLRGENIDDIITWTKELFVRMRALPDSEPWEPKGGSAVHCASLAEAGISINDIN